MCVPLFIIWSNVIMCIRWQQLRTESRQGESCRRAISQLKWQNGQVVWQQEQHGNSKLQANKKIKKKCLKKTINSLRLLFVMSSITWAWIKVDFLKIKIVLEMSIDWFFGVISEMSESHNAIYFYHGMSGFYLFFLTIWSVRSKFGIKFHMMMRFIK